jgi:hypothetical protein
VFAQCSQARVFALSRNRPSFARNQKEFPR